MPSKCALNPHSSGFSLLTPYLVFFKLQEKTETSKDYKLAAPTHSTQWPTWRYLFLCKLTANFLADKRFLSWSVAGTKLPVLTCSLFADMAVWLHVY